MWLNSTYMHLDRLIAVSFQLFIIEQAVLNFFHFLPIYIKFFGILLTAKNHQSEEEMQVTEM